MGKGKGKGILSFYRVALLESEYVVLKEGERKKTLQSVILNYTVIGEYRSTLGRSKVIFSWPHHKKSCQHLNKQRQGDERKTYGFNSRKLYVTRGSSEKKTLKMQGQRSISMLMWEEVMDFHVDMWVHKRFGPNDSGAPGKSETITQQTPYNFCIASSLCGMGHRFSGMRVFMGNLKSCIPRRILQKTKITCKYQRLTA